MSAAQPSDEILAWAKSQPPWRQDALRRILTKPFVKSEEDECLELLKAEHGIAQTKLKLDPLDKKHLPVRSGSDRSRRQRPCIIRFRVGQLGWPTAGTSING